MPPKINMREAEPINTGDWKNQTVVIDDYPIIVPIQTVSILIDETDKSEGFQLVGFIKQFGRYLPVIWIKSQTWDLIPEENLVYS